MKRHDSGERRWGAWQPSRGRAGRLAGGLLGLTIAAAAGCRDQEAYPKDFKPIETGAVEAYGVTLGPDATPQEVTYVLLRTLRDDIEARRTHKAEADSELLQRTLRLSAPNRIYHNAVLHADAAHVEPVERDTVVYKIVRYWAPIVAYYRASFVDDPAAMINAMRVVTTNAHDAVVSLDVVDPDGGAKITLKVFLTRESGSGASASESFWRVERLAYAPIPAPPPTATQPATASAPNGP